MSKIKVEFDTKDWVYICEMLAEVRNYMDAGPVTEEDKERIHSSLEALESGV